MMNKTDEMLSLMSDLEKLIFYAMWGENSVKLGNVTFWIKDGKMLHDPEMSKWDVPQVKIDLTAKASERKNHHEG